jgi:hexosaminidase
MSDLLLVPKPRHFEHNAIVTALPEQAVILIPTGHLLFEAQTAQANVLKFAGLSWPIAAGATAHVPGLRLAVDATVAPAQGYRLSVDSGQVTIVGADSDGVWNGVCTFSQLVSHFGPKFPNLAIHDWPDFPVRGVMIDISRDKVPTMQTLYTLIDRLVSWKINQVQLYMEHSFAYSQHQQVWEEASPMTGQEILELDEFCRQRHIELVPNQNSLGHMERWVKHETYKPIAEKPEGFVGHFGDHLGEVRPATSLNPTDPRSIEFMAGLYDELLPHFRSKLFNVGGDEPWELGQGRSKSEIEKRGRGRVYVDYLLKLYEEVSKRDHTMMFWADVIIKYPELIPEMPKDVIAFEWGYYAGHPYSVHSPMFAQSNIPFYVCPGTSSWNSLGGRTTNMRANVLDAARNGIEYGASGLLMTDWGDRGHWQPLPVSYPGFVYGASVAWAGDVNADLDLATALDRYVFKDAAGVTGNVLVSLGDVYLLPGLEYPNGSLLFFLLQMKRENLDVFIRNLDEQVVTDRFFGIDVGAMNQVIEQTENLLQSLNQARMACEDADLVRDEITQVGRLMNHAAQRGLFLKGNTTITARALYHDLEMLFTQQRLNWLSRNRAGGLKDSIARFEPVIGEYRALGGEVRSYL